MSTYWDTNQLPHKIDHVEKYEIYKKCISQHTSNCKYKEFKKYIHAIHEGRRLQCKKAYVQYTK